MTGSVSSPTVTGIGQGREDRETPRVEKELDSIRDRLNADDDKASETLSSTVRTVATGLALVVYTFITSKDQSPFVQAHFEAIRAASVLGLAALVADALQYIFALGQIGKARQMIKSGAVPESIKGTVQARSNRYMTLRDGMFLTKIVLVAIGSFVIIDALLNTNLATLVAKPVP